MGSVEIIYRGSSEEAVAGERSELWRVEGTPFTPINEYPAPQSPQGVNCWAGVEGGSSPGASGANPRRGRVEPSEGQAPSSTPAQQLTPSARKGATKRSVTTGILAVVILLPQARAGLWRPGYRPPILPPPGRLRGSTNCAGRPPSLEHRPRGRARLPPVGGDSRGCASSA